MSESTTGYVDYDYQPPTSGKYLNLSNKGESVRVRLVGKPYQFVTTFPDGKTALRFAWKVIHKETVNGKLVKTARVFKGATMVFNAVADLHKDDDWGNPENYDVEITRTEEKGKYYTVVPKPNGKPITDEERAMIEELGSLPDLLSGDTKPDHAAEEPDPFEE